MPSTVHPSYPYGNPFKQLKDAPGPGSNSIVDQLSNTANVKNNESLKWDELSLNELLPNKKDIIMNKLKKVEEEIKGEEESEDFDDNDNNNEEINESEYESE